MLGGAPRRPGTPAQIHYSQADPFRQQEWIDGLVDHIRTGGGVVEVFDYPGRGHLFTDPSLPAECDPQAAALLWNRALTFCRAAAGDTDTATHEL